MKKIKIAIIGFFLTASITVFSQFEIELEVFARGLIAPLDIVHHGTEQLYIVEKGGRIRIVNSNGTLEGEPFLDIRNRVNSSASEYGLLGMAFHPNYSENGEFYLNYTTHDNRTYISRFRTSALDSLKGDPNSEEVILMYDQPFKNHNGGDLVFGPDGYLYIASGDGGSSRDPMANGQNLNTYLGKLLRIDIDTSASYKSPKTNPFVGETGLDEIWAYGLRNPWRVSFDMKTGDLWIGDVGQNEWEEIDFQLANSKGGENYGWRCYEGNHDFNLIDCEARDSFVFPIVEYSNNRLGNGCSVTGGYVYRGLQFPDMWGYYLYADYCTGIFWALHATDTDTTNIQIGDFRSNQFASFGQDIHGEIYACAIRDGIIYKIKQVCNLNITTVSMDEECSGEFGSAEVVLSDSSAIANYLWSNGDTTRIIENLPPGKYQVTVTSGGCTLVDSVEILPSNLSMSCLIDTLITDIFCIGDTVRLLACIAPSGYTYEWSMGDAVLPTQNDSILLVTESGNYSVAFIGNCNLGASDEIGINFSQVPFKGEITSTLDTLFANTVADEYNWYLDSIFLTTTLEGKLLSVQSGIYNVEGVNVKKCIGPLSDPFNFTLTNQINFYKESVEIYPNPFVNEFLLNNTSNEVLSFEIRSIEGKIIESGNVGNESKVIIIKDYKGVCFVHVKGIKGESVFKVMKK